MTIYFSRLLTILSLSLMLAACSRPKSDTTTLSIQMPSKLLNSKISTQSISTTRTECFAVSVTGSGIGATARSCGPATGLSAGFVADGQTVTISDVPQGDNRTVSVYMYLLPDSQTSCPAWSASLDDAYGTTYKSVYKVGEATGIKLDKSDVTVTVTVALPDSLDNNIVAQLGQTASCSVNVSAHLLTTGVVTDTNLDPMPASDQDSIMQSLTSINFKDFSSASAIRMNTSGLIEYNGSTIVEIPHYIWSITKHPTDATKVIGMQEDGALVEVSLSTGISSTYASGSCPFASCTVPRWMKSIATGPGSVLYGLDHAGQLYTIDASGPTFTSTTVPGFVQQVAF